GGRSTGDAAVLAQLAVGGSLGNLLATASAPSHGWLARRREEALPPVVVDDRQELPLRRPLLHGRHVYAERGSHLLEGEQALSGPGQPEGVNRAAAEANVGDDLVGLRQGHVLDEEADHTHAFARWGGRVMPEPGEVGSEREHLPALLLAERPGLAVSLALVVFLGCRQRPQLVVPLRLQGVGDQAVVGDR